MKLFLSSSDHKNAAYTLESGQTIYRVNTPYKIANRVSTIMRVVPNETADGDDMRDVFRDIATIEWKTLGYSVITTDGTAKTSKETFRKVGFGWHGRHRAFEAPDGREYSWRMGAWAPSLYLNDGSDTLVAKYHQPKLRLNPSKRRAYLEIFPPGEHIADSILVTFVYLEKIRKDKERASRSHGG